MSKTKDCDTTTRPAADTPAVPTADDFALLGKTADDLRTELEDARFAACHTRSTFATDHEAAGVSFQAVVALDYAIEAARTALQVVRWAAVEAASQAGRTAEKRRAAEDAVIYAALAAESDRSEGGD